MTCRCPGGPGGAVHAQRAADDAAGALRETTERHNAKVRQLESELQRQRTSTSTYTIERVVRISNHLVLQVRYPNCEHRAYEGLKTMVFLNVTETQALKWRSIDPHFREMPEKLPDTEAPPPAARFPGTEAGFVDALSYARGKHLP